MGPIGKEMDANAVFADSAGAEKGEGEESDDLARSVGNETSQERDQPGRVEWPVKAVLDKCHRSEARAMLL